MLFFKIGTLEKKMWFCKVHVLKSGDGAGVYPHADLVLAQPPKVWSVSFSGANQSVCLHSREIASCSFCTGAIKS